MSFGDEKKSCRGAGRSSDDERSFAETSHQASNQERLHAEAEKSKQREESAHFARAPVELAFGQEANCDLHVGNAEERQKVSEEYGEHRTIGERREDRWTRGVRRGRGARNLGWLQPPRFGHEEK